MNEERMPGSRPEDQELNRRWRNQSVEEPSSSADARIQAAAREAIATSGSHAGRATRRTVRWTRFAPLAAAASVGLLAVGLVRLIPREEYQATPTPELVRPGEDHEPASAARSEAESAPEHEVERDQLYAPGAAHREAPPDEPERARERVRAPEPASSPAVRPDAEREPPASGVADRELSAAAAEDAAGNDRASVEQPPRASKAPAPAAAIGPTAISPTTSRSADSASISAIPAELATRVQNDAALRTGADPGSIRIVAVDPVAPLDPSIGCEGPGSPAPETRVPGYIVTVEASERTLRYHTDGRDRIAICENE